MGSQSNREVTGVIIGADVGKSIDLIKSQLGEIEKSLKDQKIEIELSANVGESAKQIQSDLNSIESELKGAGDAGKIKISARLDDAGSKQNISQDLQKITQQISEMTDGKEQYQLPIEINLQADKVREDLNALIGELNSAGSELKKIQVQVELDGQSAQQLLQQTAATAAAGQKKGGQSNTATNVTVSGATTGGSQQEFYVDQDDKSNKMIRSALLYSHANSLSKALNNPNADKNSERYKSTEKLYNSFLDAIDAYEHNEPINLPASSISDLNNQVKESVASLNMGSDAMKRFNDISADTDSLLSDFGYTGMFENELKNAKSIFDAAKSFRQDNKVSLDEALKTAGLGNGTNDLGRLENLTKIAQYDNHINELRGHLRQMQEIRSKYDESGDQSLTQGLDDRIAQTKKIVDGYDRTVKSEQDALSRLGEISNPQSSDSMANVISCMNQNTKVIAGLTTDSGKNSQRIVKDSAEYAKSLEKTAALEERIGKFQDKYSTAQHTDMKDTYGQLAGYAKQAQTLRENLTDGKLTKGEFASQMATLGQKVSETERQLKPFEQTFKSIDNMTLDNVDKVIKNMKDYQAANTKAIGTDEYENFSANIKRIEDMREALSKGTIDQRQNIVESFGYDIDTFFKATEGHLNNYKSALSQMGAEGKTSLNDVVSVINSIDKAIEKSPILRDTDLGQMLGLAKEDLQKVVNQYRDGDGLISIDELMFGKKGKEVGLGNFDFGSLNKFKEWISEYNNLVQSSNMSGKFIDEDKLMDKVSKVKDFLSDNSLASGLQEYSNLSDMVSKVESLHKSFSEGSISIENFNRQLRELGFSASNFAPLENGLKSLERTMASKGLAVDGKNAISVLKDYYSELSTMLQKNTNAIGTEGYTAAEEMKNQLSQMITSFDAGTLPVDQLIAKMQELGMVGTQSVNQVQAAMEGLTATTQTAANSGVLNADDVLSLKSKINAELDRYSGANLSGELKSQYDNLKRSAVLMEDLYANVRNKDMEGVARLFEDSDKGVGEFLSHARTNLADFSASMGSVFRTGTKEYANNLKTIDSLISDTSKNLRNWGKARNGSTRNEYEELEGTLQRLVGLKQKFESNSLTKGEFTSELSSLRGQKNNLEETIRSRGEDQKSVFQNLSDTMKTYGQWFLVTQASSMAMNLFPQMINNVKALDTAMTELKKVTNETDTTYASFFDEASTRAKRYGTTMTDIIDATANFSRLGYNLDDAKKAADAAVVYKNVGDNIDSIDYASEGIISSLQAFGKDKWGGKILEAMDIVDKYNEVGNRFAIDSRGVGEALKRSASAMAAAGNTIDETIALAAGANEVVQDPEKVGTALKTVSMRLRATKTDLKAAGEETEGMAENTSKLRDQLYGLTANTSKPVDIQLDADTYKSTYAMLQDLAGVWQEMSDMEQAATLELVAGKTQANVVAAILSNWQQVESACEVSANAMGSAEKENARVLESIEGRITSFQTSFQSLSSDIINTDLVKNVVSWGTAIVDVFDNVLSTSNKISASGTGLGAIMGLSSLMNWKNGNSLGWATGESNLEIAKNSSLLSLIKIGGVSIQDMISPITTPIVNAFKNGGGLSGIYSSIKTSIDRFYADNIAGRSGLDLAQGIATGTLNSSVNVGRSLYNGTVGGVVGGAKRWLDRNYGVMDYSKVTSAFDEYNNKYSNGFDIRVEPKNNNGSVANLNQAMRELNGTANEGAKSFADFADAHRDLSAAQLSYIVNAKNGKVSLEGYNKALNSGPTNNQLKALNDYNKFMKETADTGAELDTDKLSEMINGFEDEDLTGYLGSLQPNLKATAAGFENWVNKLGSGKNNIKLTREGIEGYNRALKAGEEPMREFIAQQKEAHEATGNFYEAMAQGNRQLNSGLADEATRRFDFKTFGKSVVSNLAGTAINALSGYAVGLALETAVSGIDYLVNYNSKKLSAAVQKRTESVADRDKKTEQYQTAKFLKDSYTELVSDDAANAVANYEQLVSLQNQFNSLNLVEGGTLDLINGKTDEQIAKIEEKIRLMREEAKVAAQAAVGDSQEVAEATSRKVFRGDLANMFGTNVFSLKYNEKTADFVKALTDKNKNIKDDNFRGNTKDALIGGDKGGLFGKTWGLDFAYSYSGMSLAEQRQLFSDYYNLGVQYDQFTEPQKRELQAVINSLNTAYGQLKDDSLEAVTALADEYISENKLVKEEFGTAKEYGDYKADIKKRLENEKGIQEELKRGGLSTDDLDAVVDDLIGNKYWEEKLIRYNAEQNKLKQQAKKINEGKDFETLSNEYDATRKEIEALFNGETVDKPKIVEKQGQAVDKIKQMYADAAASVRKNVLSFYDSSSDGDIKIQEEIQNLIKNSQKLDASKVKEYAQESSFLSAALQETGMSAGYLANILTNLFTPGANFDINSITEGMLAVSDAVNGAQSMFDWASNRNSYFSDLLQGPQKNDGFNQMNTALKALNQELESGYVNSNKFWAAAEYLFGSDTLDEWGWNVDKIIENGKHVQSIFGDESTSGLNFLSAMSETFSDGVIKAKETDEVLGHIQKSADGTSFDFGLEKFDKKTVAAIADAMNVSREAVINSIQALDNFYDMNFINAPKVADGLKAMGKGYQSLTDETKTGFNFREVQESVQAVGGSQKDVYEVVKNLGETGSVVINAATDTADELATKFSELGAIQLDGDGMITSVEGLSEAFEEMGFTGEEQLSIISELQEKCKEGFELKFKASGSGKNGTQATLEEIAANVAKIAGVDPTKDGEVSLENKNENKLPKNVEPDGEVNSKVGVELRASLEDITSKIKSAFEDTEVKVKPVLDETGELKSIEIDGKVVDIEIAENGERTIEVEGKIINLDTGEVTDVEPVEIPGKVVTGETDTSGTDTEIETEQNIKVNVQVETENIATDIQTAAEEAGPVKIKVETEADSVADDIKTAAESASPVKVEAEAETDGVASSITEAASSANPVTVDVEAETGDIAGNIQAAAAGASPINVDVEVNGLEEATTGLNALSASANTLGGVSMGALTESLGGVSGAAETASGSFETATQSAAGLDNISLGGAIGQVSSLSGALSGVIAQLNSLDGRQVTTTVIHKDVYVTEHKGGGPASAEGTDFASGGTTLVGELGEELVRSGDRAYFVGTNGPEFVNLKRGDQVFNAQQTRRIKSSAGYTAGAFPALAGGTVTNWGGKDNSNGVSGTGISLNKYSGGLAGNGVATTVVPATNVYSQTAQAAQQAYSTIQNAAQQAYSNAASYAESSAASQAKSTNEMTEEEKEALERQKKAWKDLYDYKQWLVDMEQSSMDQYLKWLKVSVVEAYDAGLMEATDYLNYIKEIRDKMQQVVTDSYDYRAERINMRLDYEHQIGYWKQYMMDYYNDVVASIKDALSNGYTMDSDYVRELTSRAEDIKNSIKDKNKDIVSAAKSARKQLFDYYKSVRLQEVEDEKKALNERLNNLKDFYDKQKKLLKEQFEEEDYIRDQSKKRKSVTDIESQLSKLAMDDSAWAQKKRKELEQDLKDAQEELDDFERKHSQDLALKMLDEEQEKETKALNDQIKELEKKWEIASDLYEAFLADIQSNSEKVYEQVAEWNLKHGDGIQQTIVDAWNDAYDSLQNYYDFYNRYISGIKINEKEGGANARNDDYWDDYDSQKHIKGTSANASIVGAYNASNSIANTMVPNKVHDTITVAYVKPIETIDATPANAIIDNSNGKTYLLNKKGYASGTSSATSGVHRIDEYGAETIFESKNGKKYKMFSGGEKVLTAQASDFLYNFATNGKEFFSNLARTFSESMSPLFAGGLAGEMNFTFGDVVIQGNADNQTVSEIRRAQRGFMNDILKNINKLNK